MQKKNPKQSKNPLKKTQKIQKNIKNGQKIQKYQNITFFHPELNTLYYNVRCTLEYAGISYNGLE